MRDDGGPGGLRAGEEKGREREDREEWISGAPHSRFLADGRAKVNHFPLTWSFRDTRSFSMSRMSASSISYWRSSPIVLFF